MSSFRNVIEVVGIVVDGVGVLVMVVGALITSGRFVRTAYHQYEPAYRRYRQDLGRAILLGLEFLVAGDIIRTVAVSPTMDNVLVLGLIVLIRSFLSMAIELELNGRWPWQSREKQSTA